MKDKFYRLTNKSFSVFKVKSYKGLWTKLRKKGFTGIRVDTFINIKKNDDDVFNIILSTAKEDRHYDIVKQDGWDLKNFKKNPVVLDSHNYCSIEHIIGKMTKIGVKDGKLKGSLVFAEMNPKGLLAKEMAIAGFINAVSVGFIPKEFDDKYNILKSELLELSIVSVPANPEALFEKLNKTYEKNKTKNKKSIKKSGNNVKNKIKAKKEVKTDKNNDSKVEQKEVKETRDIKSEPIIQENKESIKSKKLVIMETIAYSIKSVGEELKRSSVDDSTDRARFNRLLNKSIRELFKFKN